MNNAELGRYGTTVVALILAIAILLPVPEAAFGLAASLLPIAPSATIVAAPSRKYHESSVEVNSRNCNAKLYVCGILNPETLTLVPGTDTVLASSMGSGPGGHSGRIVAIESDTASISVLYPAAVKPRPDHRAFPQCPGPIDPSVFQPHGLQVQSRGHGTFDLYVVNHGSRESIEVFRFHEPGDGFATWIGCIPLPHGVKGNSVTPSPEGGVFVTDFNSHPSISLLQTLSGTITGGVWEWRSGSGWHMVPGSMMSGANGIELSRDDKYIFVAASGGRAVERFSRTRGTAIEQIPLDFVPDNISRAPDGRMIVAGYLGRTRRIAYCFETEACTLPFEIVAIDPATLKTTLLAKKPATEFFGTVSTGLIVGDMLWAGPVLGDRIEILPMKRQDKNRE